MKREEIFCAYFSDPISVSVEEMEPADLYISHIHGITTQSPEVSMKNLYAEPFKISFLKGEERWDHSRKPTDYFIEDTNGDFYEIYKNSGANTPPSWKLIEVEIQGNDGCVSGGAFVNVYWLRDNSEIFLPSMDQDSEEWQYNNQPFLMLCPRYFTILLEKGDDLAYILDYSECDSESTLIKLTELRRDPISRTCVKSAEYVRWFIDETPSPWEKHIYSTEPSQSE